MPSLRRLAPLERSRSVSPGPGGEIARQSRALSVADRRDDGVRRDAANAGIAHSRRMSGFSFAAAMICASSPSISLAGLWIWRPRQCGPDGLRGRDMNCYIFGPVRAAPPLSFTCRD